MPDHQQPDRDHDHPLGRALRLRYAAEQATADGESRQVARRQLAALGALRPHRLRVPAAGARAAGRWAHVDLALLFQDAGNVIHRRGRRVRTGHEPIHASKSGTCVTIDPITGRWSCASCGQRGDAVALVMALEGIGYAAAVARLIERFGRPRERRHDR